MLEMYQGSGLGALAGLEVDGMGIPESHHMHQRDKREVLGRPMRTRTCRSGLWRCGGE